MLQIQIKYGKILFYPNFYINEKVNDIQQKNN